MTLQSLGRAVAWTTVAAAVSLAVLACSDGRPAMPPDGASDSGDQGSAAAPAAVASSSPVAAAPPTLAATPSPTAAPTPPSPVSTAATTPPPAPEATTGATPSPVAAATATPVPTPPPAPQEVALTRVTRGEPRPLPGDVALYYRVNACTACDSAVIDIRRIVRDEATGVYEEERPLTFVDGIRYVVSDHPIEGFGVGPSGQELAALICYSEWCADLDGPNPSSVQHLWMSRDAGATWEDLGSVPPGARIARVTGDDVLVREEGDPSRWILSGRVHPPAAEHRPPALGDVVWRRADERPDGTVAWAGWSLVDGHLLALTDSTGEVDVVYSSEQPLGTSFAGDRLFASPVHLTAAVDPELVGAALLDLDAGSVHPVAGLSLPPGLDPEARGLQREYYQFLEATPRTRTVRDVPQGRYIAISANWGHACAIAESRELVCWGRNDFGQADPPAGRYTALGPGALCALSEAGEIACWGYEEHEFREYRDAPPGRYSALGSGTFPCALDEAGDIVCWGRLPYAGNWPDPPEGPFESVSGAHHHACAIRPGGEVTCWGVFDLADPPPGRYTAVSVGSTWWEGNRETSCGLTDAGAIVCWDHWTGSIHPEQGPYVALDISGRHGCAITELGELVCWGGIVKDLVPPARGSVRYTAVSVHNGSACALTDVGEAVCWVATPREDAPDMAELG